MIMENLSDLDELVSEVDLNSPFANLLTEYKENNQLYITFAFWLAAGKIDYVSFQTLSKWTGCYEYVLPAQREILPELSDFLYGRNRYNLFSLAMLVGHITANLSLEQQHLLLERLKK